KKMEDVEKRLEKGDTGESTRKTEGEIVKQLEGILEQIRQGRPSPDGRGMMRETRQAGNNNQPGQSNGPSNTGAGAGPMKPKMPDQKHSLANDKNTWGDLPPHLRDQMENIS